MGNSGTISTAIGHQEESFKTGTFCPVEPNRGMSLTPKTLRTKGEETLQKTSSLDIFLEATLEEELSFQALYLADPILLKSCCLTDHI